MPQHKLSAKKISCCYEVGIAYFEDFTEGAIMEACPFCGAWLTSAEVIAEPTTVRVRAYCLRCGGAGPDEVDANKEIAKARAVKNWNWRSPAEADKEKWTLARPKIL